MSAYITTIVPLVYTAYQMRYYIYAFYRFSTSNKPREIYDIITSEYSTDNDDRVTITFVDNDDQPPYHL